MDTSPKAGAATAELARRVLRALAERRVVPTPESFSETYYELAGTAAAGPAAAFLKDVLRDLVRGGRLSSAEAGRAYAAAQLHDWPKVHDVVERALARRAGAVAGNWPSLSLQLVKQVDAAHAGWTRARKVETVARLVEAAADEPEAVHERLAKLVDSWGHGAPPGGAQMAPRSALVEAAPTPAVLAEAAQARTAAAAWRQVAGRALKILLEAVEADSPAHEQVAALAAATTGATPDASGGERIIARFTDAVAAIGAGIDEARKVRQGLQRLLALLCDNIDTLSPEEAWLAGQLEPIRALLGGAVRANHLVEAEDRLVQAIAHQASSRRGLQQAKVVMRELIATLVDRIGAMGASTGAFYEQIDGYQARIERAGDGAALADAVQGLLTDLGRLRGEIGRSHDELQVARRRVQAYEDRIQALERELSEAALLAVKDPLTQTANRRGLEEAFAAETARALRHGTPLALVMVDLDDFKQLNDRLGHVAGDRALVHVATALRAGVRASDLVARIGGEEFALLLPATASDAATQLAARLAQATAASPMRHDGAEVRQTFSGGVAAWRDGETLEALLQRADEAMYNAKRTGRNRVVTATDQPRPHPLRSSASNCSTVPIIDAGSPLARPAGGGRG